MITEISGFGSFLSKNGRFVTHICFSKNALLKPLLLKGFLGARFLAQLSRKGNFEHPPKTKEKFDWKLKNFFWGYLCVFLDILFFFLFLFCFLFFFGGFKGQVRWPEGPPHLALNPPYLLLLLLLLFCFVWSCFFLSLLFNTKNLVFPLEKGVFLDVSLCFSLAFLGLPLFQFLFLCLSLVLVLFASFLSFFFVFFGSLFFFRFFLLCFCFMKGTTSKY